MKVQTVSRFLNLKSEFGLETDYESAMADLQRLGLKPDAVRHPRSVITFPSRFSSRYSSKMRVKRVIWKKLVIISRPCIKLVLFLMTSFSPKFSTDMSNAGKISTLPVCTSGVTV